MANFIKKKLSRLTSGSHSKNLETFSSESDISNKVYHKAYDDEIVLSLSASKELLKESEDINQLKIKRCDIDGSRPSVKEYRGLSAPLPNAYTLRSKSNSIDTSGGTTSPSSTFLLTPREHIFGSLEENECEKSPRRMKIVRAKSPISPATNLIRHKAAPFVTYDDNN
jgi:hypothetical protein